MTTQMIFVGLFIALAFGYQFWMRGKVKQGIKDARPAFQAFYERTGYRYADIEQQPIEAQVNRAYHDMEHPDPSGNIDLHQVRDFHGLRVHYRMKTRVEQNSTSRTYYRSNQWDADLGAPPRNAIHIADKSLDSVMKAVGEAFSNSKRHFNPKGSQKVQTGIPAIDSKYVVYADNPDQARQMLQQNPSLVQQLQDWAKLDVWVAGDGACFNDPSFDNLQAAMGGMVGNMAMGFDFAKRNEANIALHDRVAELLASLVRAAA